MSYPDAVYLLPSSHNRFCANLKIYQCTSPVVLHFFPIFLASTIFRLTLECAALPPYSGVMFYYRLWSQQRLATAAGSHLIGEHSLLCLTTFVLKTKSCYRLPQRKLSFSIKTKNISFNSKDIPGCDTLAKTHIVRLKSCFKALASALASGIYMVLA